MASSPSSPQPYTTSSPAPAQKAAGGPGEEPQPEISAPVSGSNSGFLARILPVNYFWFAAAVGALAIALLVGSLAEFAREADQAGKLREETVIDNGIRSRMREIEAVIVPNTVWDDAVVNLDNQFDPLWAHNNVGQFFSMTNGFGFTYVLDAEDRAIYGMQAGSDVALSKYDSIAQLAKPLVAQVRASERVRANQGATSERGENLQAPIQFTSPKKIGGAIYFVTATLVQPDFGTAKIRGQRAPVVITGRELDAAFIAEFAKRYMLYDVHVHDDARPERGKAHVNLKDEAGNFVATLDWAQQVPGRTLFAKIVPWTLFLLISLLAIALLFYRRARAAMEELAQSERLAVALAYHDALTNLPNRAFLEKRLPDFIASALVRGHTPAVHCLDLDHFKELNEIFGPTVGDEILKLVAQRLLAECSSDDLCVRFGGDGFAVVQLRGEKSYAHGMAKRIISALSVPLDLSIGSRAITCSVGVATVEDPAGDPLEYVRRADLALHAAKEKGRSRECMFDPSMDDRLRSRHQLLDDLRHDLATQKLRMVYQPQVDSLGQVIGVEALVRWTHPKLGEVSPADFVPLAESSGLIAELGDFTIKRVLEDARRWPKLKIAINVSAVQVRLPGFASSFARKASEAHVDPSKIEVELTEGVLLADDEQIQSTLRELRSVGFSLTLDDFGTGYSSLSYLRRFPINKIKIDRSFISSLGIEKGAEAVVAAIVNLSRALNLSIIAEGVETKEQWLHLIKVGCSQIQGHVASGAVEADRILSLLDHSLLVDRQSVKAR